MKVCQQCGAVYYGAEVFCNKDGARLGGTGQLPVETQQAPADPLIGKTIQNRYRVLRKLGEGGMGVVYTALHVDIEKKVALKVLRDDFTKRPEVVERFRQEARAASRIGHAGIVDVTDFGQLEDGGVYFAMELLQGKPLAEEVRGKCMPLLRAVPIVNQIARALTAAHRLGIVHRDLKPENIFLVERDEQHDLVKILDFGIAKISDQDQDGKRLTKTGMIFGTPEYMSPEQASGKPLDHRVDVYALGCIMFEMFTGHVPYTGESFMAVLTQHMFEPVPLIEEVNPHTDVPPAVRAVVYRAMAKELSERHADMHALELDLERALRDENYIVERGEAHSGLIRVSDGRLEGRDPSRRLDLGTTKREITGSGFATGDNDLPRRNRAGLFVGLGIASLALALGGLAYGTGMLDPLFGKEPVLAKVDSDAATTQAKNEGDTVPAMNAENPTDGVVKENKVLVRIETEPAGAIVEVNGLGQVCTASPCEVSLDVGSLSVIEASLDKKVGKLTFTPSEQNKVAHIVLKETSETGQKGKGRKRGGRGKEEVEKEPEKPARGKDTSGNSTDGLKIPDVFKEQ